MSPQVEILIIAILVATATSLPGVFLVLRKMSMMADAITHTILLGIILAFFVVHSLTSPFLILGAAIMGLITVYLVELFKKTGLVSEDSAIGIVFPLLFSIAIILVSKYAGNVHLDVDSVLLGEIALAPFHRMVVFGRDIGPVAMYVMGTILIVNAAFVILFFKELKIAIFDPALASVLGFSPVIITYALMSIVSITTVGAFEAVGSILVIAFMIGPPISAYLLTDDLKHMIYISIGFGVFNAVVGYKLAEMFDVSIAGMMAVMTGVSFLITFVVAPKRGFVSVFRRRKRQRKQFAINTILFHILNHENTERESIENGVETISNHLNWSKVLMHKLTKELIADKIIFIEDGCYRFTESGRSFALKTYNSIMDNAVEKTY